MPEPVAIDLNREEELDAMEDEIDEAVHQLKQAFWIDPLERDQKYEKLMRIGWAVARNLIPADATDGTVMTTVIREAREIVTEIATRNPDRMERRAQRLVEAGKPDKAAKLRLEIAEVRKKIAAREARRGNG